MNMKEKQAEREEKEGWKAEKEALEALEPGLKVTWDETSPAWRLQSSKNPYVDVVYFPEDKRFDLWCRSNRLGGLEALLIGKFDIIHDDEGWWFSFSAEDWSRIGPLFKWRRKRVISEAQRAMLRERLARMRDTKKVLA